MVPVINLYLPLKAENGLRGEKRVGAAGAKSTESFDSKGSLLTPIFTNRHAIH
jgi:hypothetical protein